jgi:hypothetical protein
MAGEHVKGQPEKIAVRTSFPPLSGWLAVLSFMQTWKE